MKECLLKQRKTTDCKKVKWLQQDCLQLSMNEAIPFAFMVGHGFQHFLTNTDQNKLLTSIHHVLAENGIFIFDTRFPSKEELSDHLQKNIGQQLVMKREENVIYILK